jgi:serine/threonine protein kinase
VTTGEGCAFSLGSLEVAITDFGVSTSATSLTCRTITAVGGSVLGTPAWSAPEHLLGKSQGQEAAGDVWSFGVFAWELLTGAVPWEGMEPMQVCFALVRGERLEIPDPDNSDDAENLPSLGQLRELISSCWAELPEDRPRFREVASTLSQLQRAKEKNQDQHNRRLK